MKPFGVKLMCLLHSAYLEPSYLLLHFTQGSPETLNLTQSDSESSHLTQLHFSVTQMIWKKCSWWWMQIFSVLPTGNRREWNSELFLGVRHQQQQRWQWWLQQQWQQQQWWLQRQWQRISYFVKAKQYIKISSAVKRKLLFFLASQKSCLCRSKWPRWLSHSQTYSHMHGRTNWQPLTKKWQQKISALRWKMGRSSTTTIRATLKTTLSWEPSSNFLLKEWVIKIFKNLASEQNGLLWIRSS